MNTDKMTTWLGALASISGVFAGAPAVFAQTGVQLPRALSTASPWALLVSGITTALWAALTNKAGSQPTK